MFYNFKKIGDLAKKSSRNGFVNISNVLKQISKDKLPKIVKNKVEMLQSSRIMLINNEDTIKVINFLENRGTLLKGTTRKILAKMVDLLNFLDH